MPHLQRVKKFATQISPLLNFYVFSLHPIQLSLFVCLYIYVFPIFLSVPYQIILWLNFSPVFPIDIINIDCAESERNVNNDKNEEKDHDIKDHVGHADDDWTGLTPHETHLVKK